MDFFENQGFDKDSISLHDRVEAIASSENCDYSKALDLLIARTTPKKTAANDFDQRSKQQAQAIAKYANRNNLSFSEALDLLDRESSAFTEMSRDEAFEAVLAGV